MIFGEPKRDIYVVKKNFTTVSAVMSGIGIRYRYRLEKRSIRVKQYLNPCEGGSGPMMSKWTLLAFSVAHTSQYSSLQRLNGYHFFRWNFTL